MSIFDSNTIFIKEEITDNDEHVDDVHVDAIKNEVYAEGEETVIIKPETLTSIVKVPAASPYADDVAHNSSTDRLDKIPDIERESNVINIEGNYNDEAVLQIKSRGSSEFCQINEIGYIPNPSKRTELAKNDYAILKKFKCMECEYAAIRPSTLKEHVNGAHKKLKQFKCNQCDYAASWSRNLRAHVNGVHKKLKKFKCEQCEYATSFSRNLRAHVNGVHKKLKTLKCDECEYITSWSATLKNHVNSIHKKLKKYKCQECDYAASQSFNLKVHVNSIHKKQQRTGGKQASCGEKSIPGTT